MNILVTNDDGVQAEGLWALARELNKIGTVTVVAPDRERSAIGTAVTLFEPLHADEYPSPVEGVTAYAVDGTPSDCVILALGALVKEADIVISGINPNLNLGEDVHISGTVGGALQGYFRGLPVIAVSAPPASPAGMQSAAVVAARLAERLTSVHPVKIFLNVNTPDRPLETVTGITITRLARASHINTVEEDPGGQRKRYHMTRARLPETGDTGTDIQAIEDGAVSITALYTSLLDKPPQRILKKLCADLSGDLLGV